MLLESETDLRLLLGGAAAVAMLLALLGFVLLARASAALRRVQDSLAQTETGADRTERRMFQILQAIPVALVETDTAGKFTFANRAAHQLLGRKDAELLGLRFHSATWGITYPDGRLIPPDLLPAARALRGQTVKGFQHLIVNPNTRRKMLVSVTAMPILSESGEVIGSSSAIVETESLTHPQRELEEELKPRYFDIAGVMLLALDAEGKVRDINAFGAEILGAEPSQIIGRDWISEYLPPETRDEARAAFEAIVAGKAEMPEEAEGWVLRADGGRRLIAWRGSVVRDDRGRVIATLSSAQDVTEARARAAAARDLQESLRLAQEAGRVGVWTVTPATGETYNDPVILDLWGLPRDAHPTQDELLARIHPDDRERAESAFKAAWAGETAAYAAEYRVLRPNGEVRWIAGRGEVVRDEAGRPVSLRGVGYDITDLKTAEAAVREHAARAGEASAALAESQARFTSFAEALTESLWLYDLKDDQLTYANPAYERIWGEPASRAMAERDHWRELVHPDDIARLEEAASRLRSGEARETEFRIRRPDTGEERTLRDTAFVIRDETGTPRFIAGITGDITEARRAEAALKDSEGRFRTLVEAMPQLVWSCDAAGECDYVSPGWTDYTGSPVEAFHGRGWLEFVHPDDREDTVAAWSAAVGGGGDYDVSYRLRDHTGDYRWFQARGAMMRDEDGRVRRWIGSSTDITDIMDARQALEQRVAERTAELEAANEERRRTETALAQSQRLETVGRLTGGVAHDFNNLLTVVIGALDMILRQSDKPDRVRRLGEAALAASRRGEKLTRQLLAFSRRQEFKLETLEVEPMIRGLQPLLRRAIPEDVPLGVDVAPDCGAAELDPVQFEAALLNLIVNARDALEGVPGGEIRVRAEPAHLAEGEIADAPAGDYVRIAIMDNGVGMAPDVAARALEPFFTTKEIGKGTGLGLAQVYGFARQSGGGVKIDSAPGKGAVIAIYLPRLEPIEPTAEASAAENHGPGLERGCRVLLVEDDLGVRTVAENLLLELGCEVMTASDGPAALALLQQGEAEPALLLSDIVMPGGMSGVELAHAARRILPGLKVLLSTGYAGENLDPALEAGWPVLRKPYQADDLSRALHQALHPEAA